MSLPRDDLDLIDALVWCGAIGRAAAKEAAASAESGRVATFIHERGYSTLGQAYVIVERLAKGEALEGQAKRAVLTPCVHGPDVFACAKCLTKRLSEPEQPETD